MDLSVIIVNYNVRRFLENALVSMERAMEGIDGEVMVVDNASDDGSVEMLKSRFPRVLLIENSDNLGFARANNQALVRAKGNHLLLINPDTIVQEDTFRVMLGFFAQTPGAGIAGCKILNPDGTLQLACRRSFPTPWVAFTKTFGLASLLPRTKLCGQYNLTYLHPDETYEVDAVSGSCLMISRAAYETVGGLDETYFMYGEDLDWCFRVSRAGYKVFYVHSTKIIHFKGESTRRSNIDEIKVFYQAMSIFVDQHFGSSFVVKGFLKFGIWFRSLMALAARGTRFLTSALGDIAVVTGALILGELIYFGELFHFPSYAYPIVWTIPAGTVVACLAWLGLYGPHRYSIARSAAGVITGFLVISAMVFFAKDFAFSRAVVLISAALSFVFIPGWRLAFRLFGLGSAPGGRRSPFGRRTVIVGTGESAQELLRKLRARVDDGYDVVGFIDMNRRRIGESIAGVEIVGSIDNVGKVVSERRASEVIFSTDGITYGDMLSVISRTNSQNVNFRLVPNSLEAIIGKTRIDDLETLPLVEIDYNINKLSNRVAKRLLDAMLSSLLLVVVYPLVRIFARGGRWQWMDKLPRVLRGHISLVGRPISAGAKLNGVSPTALGPEGLTGLVQINQADRLSKEEVERYLLYYAKNQSLLLDVEILLKSILRSAK